MWVVDSRKGALAESTSRMTYPEDFRKTELIKNLKYFLLDLPSEIPRCYPRKDRRASTGDEDKALTSKMAEVHDLISAKGKKAAIDAGWPADLVHAAGMYMTDEDVGLGFAYSGWAQVSLPVRRPEDDAIWSVASEKVKLLIEPGRRPKGDVYELVGVPWGCHARLILLWLQSEALRTNSRQVELGGSMREWLGRIGVGQQIERLA